MVSSLGYTLLYLFAVRPNPHLHATPTPWEATLHPPSFSLWRPGGLAALACIGAPGPRSRPGRSPTLSGKSSPYKHLFWIRTPVRSSDDARCQLVDEFATFLSEASKAFHRTGDKIYGCARRRTPVLHERSGCTFAPQKWRQLIRLDQRCHPACRPSLWGSACVTSRTIALLRYSDDAVSRTPPLSIIISMRRFLSALKSARLST